MLFWVTTILLRPTTILFQPITILFRLTTILFQATTILFRVTTILFRVTTILFQPTTILFQATTILLWGRNHLFHLLGASSSFIKGVYLLKSFNLCVVKINAFLRNYIFSQNELLFLTINQNNFCQNKSYNI